MMKTMVSLPVTQRVKFRSYYFSDKHMTFLDDNDDMDGYDMDNISDNTVRPFSVNLVELGLVSQILKFLPLSSQ